MTQPGPRVLIIDDDPSHLRLYSLIIARKGYDVHCAQVRSSTVDFPTHDVDVVTLDYRLKSRLSALDVAKMVRARQPQVPIIVLSDLAWMPDDIAPFAAAFVQKGNPDELLRVVDALAKPA
jgi:two-component system response regulator GlrR